MFGLRGDRLRVAADREVCAGSGMCVRTAPGLFDQDDDDGRVVVLVTELRKDDVAAAREAVSLCPTGALSVDAEGESSGDV
jgi:ferredoxin